MFPLLALLLAGSNLSMLAQAAPASDWYTFIMNAVPSANYVCVDQTMIFTVSISRLLTSQPGDTGPRFDNIQGVMVEAGVADEDIGQISPPLKWVGASSLKPDTAEFTFKAGKNPGRILVTFKSSFTEFWTASRQGAVTWAGGMNADQSAPVEVRYCGYKVNMILLQTIPEILQVTGTADEVKLNAVSDTKFSGRTNVKFAN